MDPTAEFAVLLAHQGGWDEFLMVAVPIVAFAFLLRAANRRLSNLNERNEPLFKQDQEPPSTKPKGLL